MSKPNRVLADRAPQNRGLCAERPRARLERSAKSLALAFRSFHGRRGDNSWAHLGLFSRPLKGLPLDSRAANCEDVHIQREF
jgi:hypothetical protein